VVQEEATKLSKRAKRRAAGEDEPEPAEDLAEGGQKGAGEGAASPEVAPAANRQARRTAAAKQRAARKRERADAAAIGLDAGEMVDDAFVRLTDKASRFGRRYWNSIQWVIGLSVIGWLCFHVYSWRSRVGDSKVSDALAKAMADERGRVGDAEQRDKPNANGIVDPTPIFENDGERAKAAIAGYEQALELRSSGPAADFARVGKAGVLLESGKADEALALYDQVANGSEAKKTAVLRGQALEGRGLCLEAKNDLPGAFDAFEKLGAVSGYENEGLYQQARIKQLQGDAAAAKALLTKLFAALGPPKPQAFGRMPERVEFLRERAEQLTSVVDPLEHDVKIPKPPLGADAVQQMLEQMAAKGGGAPAPSQEP
jgi:hypothetical protein